MRIGVQTWGSHGDVAPFLALAGGLQAAGHEVTLAVTTGEGHEYSAIAAQVGIRLVRVDVDFTDPPVAELKKIVRTADRIKEVKLLNEHYFDPAIEQLYAASTALCADSDLVIGHFWLHTLLTAATLQRVPRVVVHLCPIGVRSRYVPAAGPNLGPWINGLVWDLGDYVMTRQLFRKANALRIREGLRPLASLQRELLISDHLTLIATSPLLCRRPPDWNDDIQVSGCLWPPRLEPATSVPAPLRAFLDAGEAPVYFTFGSCEIFYAKENVELFLETLARIDERAIIQTRYADAFHSYDESKVHLVTAEVDHSQIFPRCKLVVHHGGAGTTQTTLAAGTPAIVVAHGFDQTYWGRALVEAGVSPRLLQRRSVTPARLAATIEAAVPARALAQRAQRLGDALRNEDGVATAVDLIARRFDAVP